MWILSGEADMILNSKGEWNGSIIPRLTLEIGSKVIQKEYRGKGQEDRMITTPGREDDVEVRKRKIEKEEKKKEGITGMIRKRRKMDNEHPVQRENTALPTTRQTVTENKNDKDDGTEERRNNVKKRKRKEEGIINPSINPDDEEAIQRQTLSPLAGEGSQLPVLPPQDRPGAECGHGTSPDIRKKDEKDDEEDGDKNKKNDDVKEPCDGKSTERQNMSSLAGEERDTPEIPPQDRPENDGSQENPEVWKKERSDSDKEEEVTKDDDEDDQEKKKDDDEDDLQTNDGDERKDDVSKNEVQTNDDDDMKEAEDEKKDDQESIDDDKKDDVHNDDEKQDDTRMRSNMMNDDAHNDDTKEESSETKREDGKEGKGAKVKDGHDKKEVKEEKENLTKPTGTQGYITSRRGGWTPNQPRGRSRGNLGGRGARKGKGRGTGGDQGKGQGPGGRQTRLEDFYNPL